MSLVAVAKEECRLGAPLPWTVYDLNGNVLMEQGCVIETEAQRRHLIMAGPFRRQPDDVPAAAGPVRAAGTANGDPDKALPEEAAGSFGFHDMRLRVGDRIQIQPPPDLSPDRSMVRLIGWLDNVSLLVTAPMEHGLRLHLREKDKLVARIFSGQNAFAFGTHIERICRTPFVYLHLAFPQRIQGSVIRSSPRVRTHIAVTVAGPGDDAPRDRQPALIVNLSAEGALVRAREPLCAVGDPLQLWFRVRLHSMDAHLTLKAVTRNVFVEGAGGPGAGDGTAINHGVKFEQLQSSDSVILQGLIYQHMVERPGSLT